MPSKARLSQIDRQLAELEAAEDAQAQAAANARDYPVSRLLARLEQLLHPQLVRDLGEADRRFFWPWWQLLRILSDFPNYVAPHVEYVAGSIEDAASAWVRELVDALGRPTGPDDPEADPPVDSFVPWNPLNAVTLHDVKCRYRRDMRLDRTELHAHDARTDRYYGMERAEQVSHFFFPHGVPWVKEFDPDPDRCPAEHRAEIHRRLAASGSLPPDVVPPFDWGEVRTYRYMHPFPRDRDGRPLPAAFKDDG